MLGTSPSVASPVFGTTPECVDLAALAAHTGTPAYVLFEESLWAEATRLRAALAPADPVRLYYSVKSNFETGVLATLRACGYGAEISGGVERLAIERAGFAWNHVVFDGPLKDAAEVDRAIAAGVHLLNLESADEVALVRRVAQRAGRRVRVGVRVQPPLAAPAYHAVVRTYRGKFGVALAALDRLAGVLRDAPELQWTALLTHLGSPVTRAEPYLGALGHLFAAAARLRSHGVIIDEINLGGGLPADRMVHLRVSRRFALARWWERVGWLRAPAESGHTIAARIAERAVALRRQHGLHVAVALEPGRAVVASAGVMVGRVHAVNPPWAFVDISLNDLPEKLSFVEWRVAFPTHGAESPAHRWHISGPTLATQDVLFFDHPGPALRVGDPIAVLDTGAYSIARANQFTRPRPPVYFVDRSGHAQLIRRAETAADVLATQLAVAS
jgi:diaminopimelate decarboxylase